MISWAQSLNIEFQRSIDHTVRAVGKCFEFGIMSRNKSCDAAFDEMTENGACQRRAFLRIGACAEFIEDDQRTGISFL